MGLVLQRLLMLILIIASLVAAIGFLGLTFDFSLSEIANIAQVGEAIAAIILLLFAVVFTTELQESIKVRHLDGVRYVKELIGTDEASENRKWVHQELESARRPLSPEDDARARAIGRDFDHIGFLCRHRLIPTELVVETYNQNVLDMWDRLQPFISQWRHRDEDYFAEFEWLAQEAGKAKRRIRKRRHKLS